MKSVCTRDFILYADSNYMERSTLSIKFSACKIYQINKIKYVDHSVSDKFRWICRTVDDNSSLWEISEKRPWTLLTDCEVKENFVEING